MGNIRIVQIKYTKNGRKHVADYSKIKDIDEIYDLTGKLLAEAEESRKLPKVEPDFKKKDALENWFDTDELLEKWKGKE